MTDRLYSMREEGLFMGAKQNRATIACQVMCTLFAATV